MYIYTQLASVLTEQFRFSTLDLSSEILATARFNTYGAQNNRTARFITLAKQCDPYCEPSANSLRARFSMYTASRVYIYTYHLLALCGPV